MAIRDSAGSGALQGSLVTTNELLSGVLQQLPENNAQRLDEVASEVRALGARLDRVVGLLQAHSQ